MPQPKQSLSERILRYSAVASLSTATGILVTPVPLDANASVRELNCDAIADPTCVVDFDDPSGSTPEFIFTSSIIPSLGGAFILQGVSNGGDAGLDIIASNAPAWAAILPYGVPVSSGANWAYTNSAALYGIIFGGPSAGTFGNWAGTQGHSTDATQGTYLGVKFTLDGATEHYGWIELYKPNPTAFIIKRIGYNTTAGGAIPATVQLSETSASPGLRGMVAAGLAGLSSTLLWLRRRFAQN